MSKKFEQGARVVADVYRRLGDSPPDSYAVIRGVPELERIGRSLRRIYERQCSGEMSKATAARVRAREVRLGWRALILAINLGADLYLQTDPRGGTVYLIFPGDIPEGQTVDSCYTNGVFVG